MVKITLTCRHCGSEHLVCNGLTRNGKQRVYPMTGFKDCADGAITIGGIE